MPILRKEPDLSPDNLFEHPDLLRDPNCRWWVAHTLPRQEKTLARKLHARQAWYYLPQAQRDTRSPGGRTRTSFVPLFAGYLFLYGGEAERVMALETGCIAKLLPVEDGEKLTADLRQVRQLIASGASFAFEPRLEPGMQVRVTSGPFQGFQGSILKRHSGDRLLVAVNYLQQGISISLADCQVERL